MILIPPRMDFFDKFIIRHLQFGGSEVGSLTEFDPGDFSQQITYSLGQFLFKSGGAPPLDVLAAIVGEHLFGHAVFAYGLTVGLDHVLGRLAMVKPQAGNVAAVVVQIADQIDVFPGQAIGKKIFLTFYP